MPAVAVAEGWVRMAKLLAAPATSFNVPKLELVDTPAIVAVPVIVRLPLANGEVPAVGRTRTFCHVSVQVAPLLAEVTVKTSCVGLTELIETAVPEPTSLIFLMAELAPSILTVGAALVSKMNPLGALRMIVPGWTSPFKFSV